MAASDSICACITCGCCCYFFLWMFGFVGGLGFLSLGPVSYNQILKFVHLTISPTPTPITWTDLVTISELGLLEKQNLAPIWLFLTSGIFFFSFCFFFFFSIL